MRSAYQRTVSNKLFYYIMGNFNVIILGVTPKILQFEVKTRMVRPYYYWVFISKIELVRFWVKLFIFFFDNRPFSLIWNHYSFYRNKLLDTHYHEFDNSLKLFRNSCQNDWNIITSHFSIVGSFYFFDLIFTSLFNAVKFSL